VRLGVGEEQVIVEMMLGREGKTCYRVWQLLSLVGRRGLWTVLYRGYWVGVSTELMKVQYSWDISV
jgi:hypothetical protein